MGSAHRSLVAIGMSAGGMEALEETLATGQFTKDMSLVVISHLAPNFKSVLREILARKTDLVVNDSENLQRIEKGNVYLIPPNNNMIINNGLLCLSNRESGEKLNYPIDMFFKSAAAEYGAGLVGIILSGTGTDGTVGVREVKACGGKVIVQRPESAKFDGMPISAINTGIVDAVLAPPLIPGAVMDIVEGSEAVADDVRERTEVFDDLVALLQEKTNLDRYRKGYFYDSKFKRALAGRMSACDMSSFEDYYEEISANEDEVHQFIEELTRISSAFFRDAELYKHCRETLFTRLFDTRSEPLRIWVPSCGSGEEAYSLAIELDDYVAERGLVANFQVFATDSQRNMQLDATSGIFPLTIENSLPRRYLEKYFIRSENSYQLIERIREHVLFSPHNFTKSAPLTNIDLIWFRNFSKQYGEIEKKKIASVLNFSLNAEGYVVFGDSDEFELGSEFSQEPGCRQIYKKGSSLDVVRANIAQNISDSSSTSHQRVVARKVGWDRILNDLYEDLLQEKIRPALLVDRSYQLKHVFGRAGKFLHVPRGRTRNDLLSLVPPSLSVALTTALRKATDQNTIVAYKGVETVIEDNPTKVGILVRPHKDAFNNVDYFLIEIEESTPELEEDVLPDVSYEAFERAKIEDLEVQLKETRETLQALISELQNANEELLASNEEMQSTNEELQSVNEELYSVNSEYQKKIQELTSLNSYVDNLFRLIDLGVIYLDESAKIKRYSESARRYFNLMEVDLGRPINHLTHNLKYESLADDIDLASETGEGIEREVPYRNHGGESVFVKVMPYPVEQGSSKYGLILTVSSVKKFTKLKFINHQKIFDTTVGLL